MFNAQEVRNAVAERNERVRLEAEKEERKLREKINDTITDAITNGEKDAVCHFDIPVKIQNELIRNGFFILHFVEGYGYPGYIIKWDRAGGGRGEYKGDRFKMKGNW